ncbi:guanine-N(7)--methyltransferase [Aspergillus piperis CBS 112811]|uniref:tRNA (guanine-N(7)-)-methyltransferase n=1 Tax=Aspergillus piperis CBS 112811 TaxID=1448313 RepID=A0A8G1RAM8_9EURO|nr:guanine-N(7)--methyltransferase [Aspergillus piperis CBS 112811]RAH62222.1 guanine-N(7)--methyltransferase [Aspergillus piperis CBS 112811]
MSQPPAKRQKRAEYRKQAAEAVVAQPDESAPVGHVKLPKKKFYRQRAHANPFSDHQLNYPLSPAHMDWASHFPAFVNPDATQTNLIGTRKLLKDVEVVDIGCGFGGLLVGLAGLLPETLMVGMEIRIAVLEYLNTRIQALRVQQQHQQQKTQQQQKQQQQSQSQPTSSTSTPAPTADAADADTPTDAPAHPDPNASAALVPGGYQNISAIRSNTMKFFPNFFNKHQLSKIFICFPDPHFKARKHKARIISETLNAEYAYALRPGGLLYTITDVEEYHHWILRHFRDESAVEEAENEGPTVKELFERVSEEELEKDECVKVMKEATEEGKKVTRNKGNKYVAVFRRKEDPEWA